LGLVRSIDKQSLNKSLVKSNMIYANPRLKMRGEFHC